jgi:hypothetical protein
MDGTNLSVVESATRVNGRRPSSDGSEPERPEALFFPNQRKDAGAHRTVSIVASTTACFSGSSRSTARIAEVSLGNYSGLIVTCRGAISKRVGAAGDGAVRIPVSQPIATAPAKSFCVAISARTL